MNFSGLATRELFWNKMRKSHSKAPEETIPLLTFIASIFQLLFEEHDMFIGCRMLQIDPECNLPTQKYIAS